MPCAPPRPVRDRCAGLRGADRRRPAAVFVAVLLASCVLWQAGCRVFGRSTLPSQLSDDEFWRLATELSEPAGTFTHSDNLVSNEAQFVDTMRTLRSRGGVYLGVGPEQNFSYIAEVQPVMAFIVDVRAENRSLHLLYKALFEIAADRADFVSRLFSRARPADLSSESSVEELFDRYATVRPQLRLRDDTMRLVRERLLDAHRFPLSPRDLEWIEYALIAFYIDGPDIHYARLLPHDPPGPSYRRLMTARDVSGQLRSYLASDRSFAFVKDLQARNLIVPVVGDFGGPTALRRTGDYVRRHRDVVSAFYASNVEVYLNREKTAAFCLSLVTLPYDWNTYFIGNKGKQPFRIKRVACVQRQESEPPPGATR